MVRTELNNLVAEEETKPWRNRLTGPGCCWPEASGRTTIAGRIRRRRFGSPPVLCPCRTDQSINDAGAVLLGKLSNVRAIELANRRDLLIADLDGRLGVALRIEAQRRQMDKAILVKSGEIAAG